MKNQFLGQKSIVRIIILVRDLYQYPNPFWLQFTSLFLMILECTLRYLIRILFLLGRRKKRKPVRHRVSSDNVIASTDLANGIFGGGSGWGDKVGGGVSDESNVSNPDTISSAQQSSRGQQPLIAALGFVISRTIGVPPSSRCAHQRIFVAVY